MLPRLKSKIQELEHYLCELKSIIPPSYELYVSDLKTKAACERYFEKIIEATVDVAFLILKEKQIPSPEEDKAAFETLSKENIISLELADRLKEAKGMRNILAHEYGIVDDVLVFSSVTSELLLDVTLFITSVKKIYKFI